MKIADLFRAAAGGAVNAACLLAVLGFCGTAARGAELGQSPNLSGFWELHFDSINAPPAALTPAVAAEDPGVQYKHDMYEVRWCHFFGVPYVMLQSPIDIVQNINGKEVI